MAEALAYTTFEQYLDDETASESRHELVGGRVYALAGGSERHDLVAGLLYETLAPGARARGCRRFPSHPPVPAQSGQPDYPDGDDLRAGAPHPPHQNRPPLD